MRPRFIHCGGALALFTLLLQLPSAFAQSLSIEGTYRLVSRTLKDGTVLKPPEVIGLQTFTKEHRQFNIIGKDPEGKIISRSIGATYKLTPTEYTETPLFHIFVRGQEIRNLSDQPQRTTVAVDGGRITFKTEQRVAVYEGNKFTATADGNVDVWEKVE